MRTLYPEIHPFQSTHIKVDDLHDLYLEQSGDPHGLPVLVIHGGPGSGCSSDMRRFFDPERYHIILFDQRGAGKSKPHGEIRQNTTQDLIADIEKIRQHLNIESWCLFGGSWGSTLALLYAQQHPDQVRSLILRGIFLSRESDYQWLYGGAAGQFFPEEWQQFLHYLEPDQRDDPIHAYHEALHDNNELLAMNAAKHWNTWETSIATLNPQHSLREALLSNHQGKSRAKVQSHYLKNRCFIDAEGILPQLNQLNDMRIIIIHGRYDMVCPVENAHSLWRALPSSELDIIRAAGHSAFEPPIIDALVKATDEVARELGETDHDA